MSEVPNVSKRPDSEITDRMVVMVCGSRGWDDADAIYDELRLLPEDALIIHGGAEGADMMAHVQARELGYERQQYLPHYQRPSPQRYHERNDEMLRDASFVLAFWDGRSPGTASVIEKAKKRGLPYKVIRA